MKSRENVSLIHGMQPFGTVLLRFALEQKSKIAISCVSLKFQVSWKTFHNQSITRSIVLEQVTMIAASCLRVLYVRKYARLGTLLALQHVSWSGLEHCTRTRVSEGYLFVQNPVFSLPSNAFYNFYLRSLAQNGTRYQYFQIIAVTLQGIRTKRLAASFYATLNN